MTIEAVTMYRAKCDAPGCELRSSDYLEGNNAVYATVLELDKAFAANHEGSIADEQSWLCVLAPTGASHARVEMHYCGNHTTWDDSANRLIPAHLDEPSLVASLVGASAGDSDITESENA